MSNEDAFDASNKSKSRTKGRKSVKMNPRMLEIEQTHFWDKDGYKADVKRIDDNVHQLDLLNKFFSERADIEIEYAKRLRQWKEKFENSFAKSTLYGSHQAACTSVLEQSVPLCNLHDQIGKLLQNDCSARLQEWKRSSYHPKVFGGFKEHDNLNKEFIKGQKSWLKMNEKVEKQRKLYHQLAATSSKAPSDEASREVKLAEDKYVLLLDELQQVAPVYVGEMKRVHQKAQNIEKRKIQFMEDILGAFVTITDLSKYQTQINSMGALGLKSVNLIHSSNDLDHWDQMIGFHLPLAVAAFEPYEENVVRQSTHNHNMNNNQPEQISANRDTVSSISSFQSDEAEGAGNVRRDSVKMQALYDYKARDVDEIDLTSGEEFERLQDEDERGWSRGRLNSGKEGLYPAKYAAAV